MEIKYTDINEWICSLPTAEQENLGVFIEHDLDKTICFDQYVGSTTSAFGEYLAEYFDWHPMEKSILFDADKFYLIDALCNLIDNEYDGVRGLDGNGLLWELFDMGGDDDVDYNSSYITAAVEIIRAYLKK